MLLIGFPPLRAILLLPIVLQQLKHGVHFLAHLCSSGTAGFVMANGSCSSNQSSEADIRKNIIVADLVELRGRLAGPTPAMN